MYFLIFKFPLNLSRKVFDLIWFFYIFKKYIFNDYK